MPMLSQQRRFLFEKVTRPPAPPPVYLVEMVIDFGRSYSCCRCCGDRCKCDRCKCDRCECVRCPDVVIVAIFCDFGHCGDDAASASFDSLKQ